VRVLQWRPRQSRTGIRPPIRFPAIGEYVGRARYLPDEIQTLDPVLRSIAGHILELRFAGLAPPGPLGGQCLYQEYAGDELLDGRVIPERDLEFVHD